MADHRVPDGFGNDQAEAWPAGNDGTCFGVLLPQVDDERPTARTASTFDGPVEFDR